MKCICEEQIGRGAYRLYQLSSVAGDGSAPCLVLDSLSPADMRCDEVVEGGGSERRGRLGHSVHALSPHLYERRRNED